MRHLAILILAIFLVSSMNAPAWASTVNVSLSGQQVHAVFALTLVQNMTSFPSVKTTVGSGPGSNVSAAFTDALSAVDPSASASDLSVGVTSVKNELNTTCSMTVDGVTKVTGDILTINMTWLPFNVNSDLVSQNLSFNVVGAKYFRPIVAYYANASRFVGLPNATITGVTFFMNGTSVGAPTAENYVGNYTTLNFNAINPDLDQWNRTYTLNNDTTTWRYFPPIPLKFDMQIERKNVTTNYVATYGYGAVVSVSGVGRSQGDLILVGVGTGESEWAMVAIVILAVSSAFAVQLLIRSRKRKLVRFQKR